MNTKSFPGHAQFVPVMTELAGRTRTAPGTMRGDIIYDPASGSFRFGFQPNDAFPFAQVAVAYELAVSNAPFLSGNISYNAIPGAAKDRYEAEKTSYAAYRIPVVSLGRQMTFTFHQYRNARRFGRARQRSRRLAEPAHEGSKCWELPNTRMNITWTKNRSVGFVG